MLNKVVVVGGVAGGASFAARLRRLSEEPAITVFERGPFVSFANCGLPYYIGQTIKERTDLLLADAELFKKRFNVQVKTGHEVIGIDRQRKTVKVKSEATGEFEEPYDYLVLSPGALPVRPPLPGIESSGIFVLRSIPDSDDIKNWAASHISTGSAVIVGGGFIGLEMAENLHRLGKRVTIVEKLGQVMPPFDGEMMSSFHSYLKEKDIALHLGTTVTGFSADDKGVITTKTDKGDFPADIVILSIGVRPDTRLAKECGLELGTTGGIKVNDQMRTSDPSVFAVGDCVESIDFVTKQPTVIPLAGPANRQARIAADALMGQPARFRGVQGTAVCKVFDMLLAMTGASEKTLKRYNMKYEKVYLHPNNHAGYYPGATKISIKLLFSPSDGKILGAQAIGREGTEKRIDVIATAIQGGMTVYDLEEAEMCYAPQVGAAKDPINLAGFIAADSLRNTPVVNWNTRDFKTDGATLLDVRSQGEYEKYHIEGAKLIPLPELRQRAVAELDKNKKVYVHCAVGQRGYYATRMLRNLGFDAYNYSGGTTTQQMVANTVKL